MNSNATSQNKGHVWRAESLRLTAFLDLAEQIEPLANWQDLVGSQPHQRSSQLVLKQIEENGPFAKGILSINAQPGRIDLQYQSLLKDVASLGDKFPDLGSLREALDVFVPLMLKWLEKSPPLLRLAFGAEISIPVSNHVEAYRLLDSYLPVVTVDPESSDFNYSINRKRSSGVGISGLRINRLSRWYALLRKIGMKTAEQVVSAAEFYSCRVEFDMNTDPASIGLLPKEKLKDVFQELVSLGVEISEKGDVP